MLKEIAFTPHIFDEMSNIDNPNWADQLYVLGERLFPWQGACPFVVSNLYDGSWEHKALEYIQDITSDTKAKAQSLLVKIKEILVTRPAFADWPGEDEIKWAREAIELLQNSLIHRLVACISTTKTLRQEGQNLHALSDVTDSGFWNNLQPDDSPPRIICEQIKRLKMIGLHAGFISISSAHIYGGEDCETGFVQELIKLAASRPANYGNVLIDVHCQATRSDITESSPIVMNVKESFEQFCSDNTQVRIYFWPKTQVLDRILLSGDITTISGKIRLKPRWGIYMGHIARRGENNPNNITQWSLLGAKGINHWNHVYYQSQPTLGPLDV